MKRIILAIALILFAQPAFAINNYMNLPDPMTFQWFGAACDNSTDDAAIINQVIGYALHSGHCIHVVGSCRATSQQIAVDLNGFESSGICIYGDGTAGLSRLELEGNSANPPFIVHDSAGGSVGALFARIGEKGSFDIQTNNASGPGVQIGNHDFSDAINSSVFNINVHNNASSGSNVAAIEANWVLQSEIKGLSGNSGTLGDAIRVRQAQFDRFFGSYGGAAIGVHIVDGNSFSNTFDALDVEANTTDVQIDSSTAYTNTFLNPQLSHWTSGTHINATAGSTLFINPNFYENTGQISGSTGLFVMGPGHNMPAGYPNYPAGSGTVTSAGFTGDGVVFNSSVTGSPITTSGSFVPSLHTQSANKFFAGPSTGADAAPTFRNIVSVDLPVATTSAFGAIKPDGSTVTISAGVISAPGSGGGTVNSGTAYQMAQYQATGAAVSPVSVPNCPDSGGNHLNFNSSTGTFTCGASSSGSGNSAVVAWAYFDGTATSPITPSGSLNVSSVTKNGTGDYTINFTSSLSNTNYAVAGVVSDNGTSTLRICSSGGGSAPTTKTTSAVRVCSGNANVNYDFKTISVIITD